MFYKHLHIIYYCYATILSSSLNIKIVEEDPDNKIVDDVFSTIIMKYPFVIHFYYKFLWVTRSVGKIG